MTHMMSEILSQPEVLSLIYNKNMEYAVKISEAVKERDIHFAYIAARGTSDHAAVYTKYIFETYANLPVALAAPSVFTLYNSKPDLRKALVIGISQSGKAEDVLEVIRQANEMGAITVSITNYNDSPLAKEAKYHLCCEAGEEISVAATKTFTSTLMNAALIAAALSGKRELLNELKEIPEKINDFLLNYGISDKVVSSLADMDECFVLARGINYAIALEAALKIQETCYVRAKGFALSDFYHGPMAMLDNKIPVLLIAPKGVSEADTVKMFLKLKELKIKVLAFTDINPILQDADHCIPMPEFNSDFTSPIAYAVAVQMFACMLSLEKGLDPDNPRNLKKVTITR